METFDDLWLELNSRQRVNTTNFSSGFTKSVQGDMPSFYEFIIRHLRVIQKAILVFNIYDNKIILISLPVGKRTIPCLFKQKNGYIWYNLIYRATYETIKDDFLTLEYKIVQSYATTDDKYTTVEVGSTDIESVYIADHDIEDVEVPK